MQILKSISLDFGRKSEYKTVYAKRYEAMNSSLEISLLNYGESFNLGSNMTAKMQLLKPDGKLIVADAFSSSNEFRALDEALYQVGTVISSAETAES